LVGELGIKTPGLLLEVVLVDLGVLLGGSIQKVFSLGEFLAVLGVPEELEELVELVELVELEVVQLFVGGLVD